jgi:hypothetical protein
MKWAVLLIFGTIGLAALIGGVIWGLESYPVFHTNESTQGTVVDQFQKKNEKTFEVVYFPVIEFISTKAERVRFQSSAGSTGAPAYDAGTIVDVLYDPHNPKNAMIGSFKQLWLGPLTTGGIGFILLLLSIVLFVKIGRFEQHLQSMGPYKKMTGNGT